MLGSVQANNSRGFFTGIRFLLDRCALARWCGIALLEVALGALDDFLDVDGPLGTVSTVERSVKDILMALRFPSEDALRNWRFFQILAHSFTI